MRSLQLRSVRLSGVLVATYFVAFVLWYFMGRTQGATRTFVSDAAYLPPDVAAVVLAVRSACRAGTTRDRGTWILVALSMGARSQGDATWWWLEAVVRRPPYPSMADAGFTGFYLLLIAALVTLPVRPQSRR